MQEFKEYPKWLPIGDGVIVWGREEEESLQKQEYSEEAIEPKKRGRPRKGQ